MKRNVIILCGSANHVFRRIKEVCADNPDMTLDEFESFNDLRHKMRDIIDKKCCGECICFDCEHSEVNRGACMECDYCEHSVVSCSFKNSKVIGGHKNVK